MQLLSIRSMKGWGQNVQFTFLFIWHSGISTIQFDCFFTSLCPLIQFSIHLCHRENKKQRHILRWSEMCECEWYVNECVIVWFKYIRILFNSWVIAICFFLSMKFFKLLCFFWGAILPMWGKGLVVYENRLWTLLLLICFSDSWNSNVACIATHLMQCFSVEVLTSQITEDGNTVNPRNIYDKFSFQICLNVFL